MPDLLARTAVAAVAAVAVNVLVGVTAVAAFDIPDDFEHIEVRAVVLSTLTGVIAAAVVYAIVGNDRTFVIVAVVALVLSLAAPLSLGFDEAAGVGALMLMHVLTAAIVVVSFTRAAGRSPQRR